MHRMSAYQVSAALHTTTTSSSLVTSLAIGLTQRFGFCCVRGYLRTSGTNTRDYAPQPEGARDL